MAEQNGTNTGKCAEEYVVKRGDSFYLIAHKLGVPLRDLLAANRDIHPARLMVGDVLCVPREEDDSPQTGGLGGSGTTQTTQATGTAPSTGNPQTTQATGAAPSTGKAQTTQHTGATQATGTTQTTQVTGTVQATGTTQAVQPTCMTGQIAPDTTLSCTEDEQWTVQKGQTVSDLQLRGLVSRHTLETARQLPVVINPHGGPWARDSWGYSSEVQFLCNRGYAVFQMNFRGSTGYGRRFLEASYKQWGQAMQNDITDGVNWLA